MYGASSSFVQACHSRYYHLHPTTMALSSKNIRLVPRRLCGLASYSGRSVYSDKALAYRTVPFVSPQTIPSSLSQLLFLLYRLQPFVRPSATGFFANMKKTKAQNKTHGHSRRNLSTSGQGQEVVHVIRLEHVKAFLFPLALAPHTVRRVPE